MPTTVAVTWAMSSDQVLSVEVSTDQLVHDDALDELARRAIYLLNEALAAVTEKETT